MKSRALSIAVCLSIVSAFAFGSACTSVPDRKVLPFGFSATDAGQNGTGGSLEAGVGGLGGGVGGRGTGGAPRGGAANADAGDAASSGGENQGDGGVTCAGISCTDFTGFQTKLPACCTGVGQDICGLDTTSVGGPGCLEPNQPGNVDPTCPSQTGGAGLNGAGCCLNQSSTCGITFSVAGGPDFGCADLSLFGSSTATPCTPACSATKGPCTTTADCCDASPKTATCVTFTSATSATCSYYCTAHSDCASGCCVILTDARGVCAPDASYCPAGCGKADTACTSDADCCVGNVCVASGADGPRICRPACTTSQQCAGTVCLQDSATSEYACTRPYAALCLDTCVEANDGYCEDGGPGSDSSYCALGTDCADCSKITGIAARLGGTGLCDDTCSTSKNGVCEDAGTGATGYTCRWGTDCVDCGPRLGICTDDCPTAHDKECDDGGPNSVSSLCAPGTDCGDCGVRSGGRGQQPCDGSTSVVCQPTGGVDNFDVVDHSCECPDCPWDAPDCGASKYACDGFSISACCAADNPCGIDSDGVCDCGGFCDWETSDCRITGAPKCDGISISTYCSFKSPDVPDQFCDCGAACSWEAADCALDYPNYVCSDTCSFAGDGQCDDAGFCAYGTDCADCGPRLAMP